jgi:hypothetical protein
LDYIRMALSRMNIIKEELIMKVFHPSRFGRYLNMGYDLGDDSYIID